MVDSLLAFVPNLIGAAIILGIGWFIATLVRRIVSSLLAAAGLDRVGDRAGISNDNPARRLSGLVGTVIYALILLPVLIAALDALAIEAVATPVSNMLDRILVAIPNIFAAGLIVVIAVIVGRIVAELVSTLLEGIGFDGVPGRLGLNPDLQIAGRTPSGAGGLIVLVAIALFASLEAANLLGFVEVADLVSDFTSLGGHVLLGTIIIGIGLFFSNVAAGAIRSSDTDQAGLLAIIARVAILVFAGAIGLREMGIADEIVILAFGIPLAAIALAAAVAIGVSVGVGGREVASQEVARLRDSLRGGGSGS